MLAVIKEMPHTNEYDALQKSINTLKYLLDKYSLSDECKRLFIYYIQAINLLLELCRLSEKNMRDNVAPYLRIVAARMQITSYAINNLKDRLCEDNEEIKYEIKLVIDTAFILLLRIKSHKSLSDFERRLLNILDAIRVQDTQVFSKEVSL